MNKLQFKIIQSALVASALLFSLSLRAELILPADYHHTNSPVVAGFRLTIATTNEFFTVRQPILLTVYFENASTNDAIVSIGLRPFLFTIIGPDGKPVSETEIGKMQLEPTRGSNFGAPIKAGESYTSQWGLSALFSMTNAGEYSVTVLRKSQGNEWLAGPLKIVINEPKAANEPANRQ